MCLCVCVNRGLENLGFWLIAGQMEKPGRMREERVSKGGYLIVLDVLAMATGCGKFRQKSRVGHTPRH